MKTLLHYRRRCWIWVLYEAPVAKTKTLGFFSALLSLLHLTGLWPHNSVSPAQIQAFEKVLCHWPLGALLNTSSAKNIWGCVVHLPAAHKIIRSGAVIQILKKQATCDDTPPSVWVSCQSPEWSEINHSQGCQLVSARRHLSLNPCQ